MTGILGCTHILASVILALSQGGRSVLYSVIVTSALAMVVAGYVGLGGLSQATVGLSVDILSLDSLGLTITLRAQQWCLSYSWALAAVSWAVISYGLWYLNDSPRLTQFTGWMLAFTGSMHLLLLSDDALTLFVAWEAVGATSMLLIGFYSARVEAQRSAIKAVLYNRIGDVGLLIGLALPLATWGDSSLAVWYCSPREMLSTDEQALAVYALTLAVWTKSAQYGAHSWLLDAMEGPTPVSALLHSATLVTAGICALAKLLPPIASGSVAQSILLPLGLLSTLLASACALTTWDVKRAVAFSTMAHMGVATAALGASQTLLVSTEHLMTHAWAKSLLFMLAGCMLHDVRCQDQRGGESSFALRPIVTVAAALASLSVAGAPGSAIGASKDAILEGSLVVQGCSSLALGILSIVFLAQGYTVTLLLAYWHSSAQSKASYISSTSLAVKLTIVVLALTVILLPSAVGELLTDSRAGLTELLEASTLPDLPAIALALGLLLGSVANQPHTYPWASAGSNACRALFNRLWVDSLANSLAARLSSSMTLSAQYYEQGILQELGPLMWQRHLRRSALLADSSSTPIALLVSSAILLLMLVPSL